MESAIFILPVQSGRTRAAMVLLSECDVLGVSSADQPNTTGGLTAIDWYLSVQPTTSFLIAQLNGAEPVRGFLELTLAESEQARDLRAALSEIGGMELDARTIERLMHAPLARFPVSGPPPAE